MNMMNLCHLFNGIGQLYIPSPHDMSEKRCHMFHLQKWPPSFNINVRKCGKVKGQNCTASVTLPKKQTVLAHYTKLRSWWLQKI